MSVCFDGIGAVVATFRVEEGAQVAAGQAVALVGDGTVGLGADGSALCGVAVSADGGYAAVQVGGMVTVGLSGTAPAVGWNALAVDGAGKVKAGDAGVSCMVVSVDAEAMTAVIKL